MPPECGAAEDPLPCFFYRQAVLPLAAASLRGQLSWPADADGDARAELLQQRLTSELAELQEAVRAPYVSAAIAYTSDYFTEVLRKPFGERAAATVHDYLMRACGRPAPFGWFGAVGVGAAAGDHADLASQRWSYHTIPSARLLAEQARRAVELDPAGFTYTINPLCSRGDGEIRYLASKTPGSNAPQYVSAPMNNVLAAVIESAALPVSWESLVKVVQRSRETSPEHTEAFLHSLIAWDLLVPSAVRRAISPSGSGPASALNACAPLSGNFRPSDPAIPFFRKQESTLFVSSTARLNLPPSSMATLTAAADVLRRLCPPPAVDRLASFTRRFQQRFEDATVPLKLALSDEAGLGYGADVWDVGAASGLRAIGRPHIDRSQGEASREQYLFERVLDSMARQPSTLDLTDEDVEKLAAPGSARFPLSYAICATLLPADPDSQVTFRLDRVVGPSGARLLSRFWPHAEVRALGERHAQEEERAANGATLAEVIFAPGDALDMACRPNFYGHHIDCHGWDSTGTRLALDDLFLSVVNGQLILSSRTLGAEVLPRITSAHNYALVHYPRAYRLLGDLQGQGAAADVSWRWGPLAEAPHLPQVRWRGVTLVPRRWRLRRAEWLQTAATQVQNAARLCSVLERRGLPRYVTYQHRDEARVVDRQSATSLISFARRARSWTSVVLSAEDTFNSSSDLGIASWRQTEIVVPLVNPAARPKSRPAVRVHPPRTALPPGSDWIYLKLYGTPAALDSVLASAVRAIIAGLRDEGLLTAWYYIRYTDPQPHLRIRVLAPGAVPRLTDLLAAKTATALDSYQLWTVDMGTHRSGGQADRSAERRWATADSDIMLAHLACPGLERWQLSLASMLSVLAGTGLAAADQLRLIDGHMTRVRPAVHAWEAARRELGRRWRLWQPLVAALDDGAHQLLRDRLTERDATVRAIVRESGSPEAVRRLMHRTFNRSATVPDPIEEMALLELARRIVRQRLGRQEGIA